MSKRLEMVKSGESFEEMVAICSLSRTRCVVKSNYKFYSPRISRGTECDVIVITENKIYCVECKNFSDYIMGADLDIEWVFSSSGRRNRVSNPVLGNYKHIRTIRGLLRQSENKIYEIENIVCVPDRCKIKSKCKEVITLSSFLRKLDEDKRLEIKYNLAEVSRVFDKLKYNEEDSDG